MFPPKLAAPSAKFPPILYVTTDKDGPVQFTVSYTKANPSLSGMSMHTARNNSLTRIELPFELTSSFTGISPNKGQVNLKAEEGKNIIVYALNEGGASTDVYLGLPYFETKTKHTITMVSVFLAVVLNQRLPVDIWPLLYRKLIQS